MVWKSQVSILLVLIILVSGCIQQKEDGGSKPVGDVYANLNLLDPFKSVGSISTLEFSVTPQRTASNATMTLNLPEGLELLEGGVIWHGKISANEKKIFTFKLKALKAGKYTIRATIFNDVPEKEIKFGGELGGGNTARLNIRAYRIYPII